MSERRSVYDALGDHPEAQQRYRESEKFREAVDELASAIRELSEACESDEEYLEFLNYAQAYLQEWTR